MDKIAYAAAICNPSTTVYAGSEYLESIANHEIDASTARNLIWQAVESGEDVNRLYSALCRWTWRVLKKQHVGDDLRSWHRLMLDSAAKISAINPDQGISFSNRTKLNRIAVVERIRALADLVWISIRS